MTSHDQAALASAAPTPGPNPVIENGQDWLARLAHDLRSPLVAIGYASQMLRSGRAPPQRTEELFATIERQTAQLGRLAEEIGDMLLIGSERFRIRRGHCDLVAVVREALQEPTPGTPAFAHFAGGNAVGVRCDRARLVQLLRHVVRLTGKRKPGGILPTLEITEADGHARLRFDDPSAAIYRGDALLYLAHGTLPEDPGVLCMSDIITRRILEAHDATLAIGECVDDRTGHLTLDFPST